MPISETKMKIVIDNYFKAECNVNTSIRDAFEKGFRIGVQKGYDVTKEPERKTGKWEVQPSTGDDRPFIWWKCSVCGHVIFSETERDRREFHAFCGRCGADMRGE